MRKLPAYHVYLGSRAGLSLFGAIMGTVSTIYRIQTAGLTPLQLVLVGTVLEITVFLFEIPTGVVADLRSRRLSVVIGYFLIGFGFMIEGLFPVFGVILLAQVVWGLGATFTSGAEDAWLGDELGDDKLTHVYLRASQIGQLTTLLGIGIGVGLGTLYLGLPLFLGGLGTALVALFLALFMPEDGFKPTPAPERNTWQKVGHTMRQGASTVRGRPMLQIILAIGLIYGLSSEGLDRLWEAHMLANIAFPALGNLQPVVWFGLINVGQLLLVVPAAEMARRRLAAGDQAALVRWLLAINAIMVGSLFVFALALRFPLAVLAIWGVSVFRSVSGPLYSAWLNKGLPSEARATVISMSGQIDAIGQIAGGPPLGVVANAFSTRAAMIGVGLLLSPALALYGVALRRLRPAPTPLAVSADAEI